VPSPAALRAFRHRDYRVFFAGQAVSLVGTWMQSVAQAWLVLQLTGSPLRLGLVSALQFLPLLVLSVPAGALTDRVRKRRTLVATQAALGGLAATLALLVWTERAAYWQVCAIALGAGLVNTLDTPTRQTFVAQLVGRDDVASAIGLNSAAFNTARIVGPAVAGLLIAHVGLAPAFALNAASFLGVIGALLALRDPGAPRPRGAATMWEDIRAGLAYALGTPRIRLTLAVLLVMSLCVFNFNVFVALIARQQLGLDARGFGFLMAWLGAGAVTGALALAARTRRPPPLLATGLVACAGLAGLAGAGSFVAAAAGLYLVGAAGIMTVSGCNTTLQLTAPDELRGRVMSLYTLIFGGSIPLGALAVGAVSEAWGVSRALLAAGLGGAAALAVVLVLARHARPGDMTAAG
jgi:predicted MFS family arabinose efflux permease